VSGQLHALVALHWGKRSQYPLDKRMGGPQSQSGNGGKKKKNSLPPPGLKPWLSNL